MTHVDDGSSETYAFPASFAQERLWFFNQLVPDLAVYNLGCPYELSEVDPHPDPDTWLAAFAAVVQRHESLRTHLEMRDGELMQIVHAHVQPTVTRTDLRDLGESEAMVRAEEIACADAATPIPLDQAPLWRARLIRHATDDWMFILVVHHAVFDAQSVPNLTVDLYETYRAMRARRAPQLPDLPIQYADFTVWQRSRMADGGLDDQLDYWKTKLAELPDPLRLPVIGADRDRDSGRNRGGVTAFTLPPEIATTVAEIARAEVTTPFVVLLSAFSALLSRMTGQTDMIIGSPVSGRVTPELQSLVGMFVNTLMVRVDCSAGPSFRDLVRQVRGTLLDALDNQEIPYDRLVELLAADRVADGSPLHQVVFNMLPMSHNTQIRNGTAKVDLLIDLADTENGYDGRMEYRGDLMDAAAAATFTDRLRRLLTAALADPDISIDRLSILDEAERRHILDGAASTTRRPADAAFVVDLFEAQVDARPSGLAAADTTGRGVTYQDLDEQANQLARQLADTVEVGADTTVAILLETGVQLAVTVLAVLKAGAAYLPLDQQHPAERMRYLINDARAVAVLTDASSVSRLPALDIPVIDVDAQAEAIAAQPTGRPARTTPPDALAYVIYTSGSTGEPKGVGVTRGNLASYADELGPLLDAQPGRVFSMLQPLTFDFSVTMFYGALVSGGALHLVSRDFATDSHWVAEHLRRDQVDYMKITPSHLRALQAGADLGSLLPRRMLLLGGEASDMAWVRSLRTARPGSTVVNHYGPTETTVGAVALPGDRDPYPDAVFTPLGWPLAHARAYVLDQRAEPVPDGVVGELYLGGATVARGYLHRPAMTAARFLPDPFADRPGARLYRTGDRARRRPDGSIEFLGRVDDQVKVHGYRVEPDEVRHVLREHPAVADCAVVPYGDGVKTDVQLIGYVVVAPDTGFDPADLHAYMAERLPEFMVPSAFVALDALPLTAHGKVDRSRLPAPVVEAAPLADPPVGATEDLVAALFSLLLGRDGIGRQDNFFGLGGHSLLAIQLVTRLRASFGIGMPLRAVFEDPTVTGVARQVEIQLRKRSRQLPPVEPLKAGDPLVASMGQRRLWFLDQLEGSEPLYNTNIRHRVTGPLNVPLLGRAFVEVVRRHEVLRSRFVTTDGELFQQVLDEPSVPYRVVDFSAHPADTRTAAVEQALEEHSGQAIDLATEPPLRVLVATVTPEEHVLLITAHHVVNDAWSAGLMMRELGELYAAFRDEQPSPLAPLPVQYADFAAWQRKLLAGPLRDTQLRYWRQQLAGAPQRLELPTDRPRPLRRGYAGDHVLFDVPDSVVARLRALGADGNASLFMVLLAAFKVLLTRYCGQSDVVVGTPSSNRPRPELEPLIGFFLNTLALRTDCSGDPTFADLLARVRNTTLDAFANSDVPFEALVDELAVGRDLGGTPLVQVLFTLEDAERTATTAGDVEFSWQPFGTPTAKFDVTLYLWRRAAGLSGAVEFRTDLFDRTTMQRFAENFRALLSGAAYDPTQRISELFVPSTDDISRIGEWNATAVSYVGAVTLAGGVAAAVAGSPDARALCFRDEWLSYREFGGRVNRLARRLCAAGVGVGDVVGVCLDRGADLVVAVHAVVAAGAAYLPLEPDYPDDRLMFMVADAGVGLVITDRETRFPGVSTMAAAGEPDGSDGSALKVSIPPDALAYVIYTSGSTGRPKGVGVSHRAIVNRLSWMQQAFPLTGSDRVLHKTPFSFDVSVWELFWPLLVGAGLVVADAGGQRDPAYLGRLIESQEVSTVHFVPSMLDVFLDQPDVAVRCASLRRVMASGEALSPGLVARWYRVLPGVGLHNLYGPTEAAVDVTWHATLPGESRTPIGRPIANTRIEIVDADGQRVPIGTVGELCIGGVQLARGYLNRPSLTAERFVPDAFGAPGARLYRSGDLARWLPDGEVEYLGRIDHQVKVRGFRIELGEIEAALVDAPQVRSAVVTTYQDGSGSRLVGYVVPVADNGTDPDLIKTLQARLRERLPEHMVPASLVTLAELPLTANGKLARDALPAPQPVKDRPFTPPRSTAEQHIAQIWSDVLGVTQVSADDDFFALGGDSIRSLKVIARLRTNGYTLNLEDIFLQPKLDGLANHLVRDESAAAEPARTEPFALLDPAAADKVRELVPAADSYPLAALQAGMLFHSEYEPGSAVYHDVFTLWLTTPYDREALADSLAAVAAIHPVLRTSVHLALLDDPVQIVHRDATIPLVEADIADLPPEASNAWIEAFVESEKRHPFDLTTPPLLRVFAHRRSDGFALTLSFHHAILDGWSVATLTTELLSRYAARLDGRTLPVEPLPIAYSEFVAAERGTLDSAESAEFWRSTLADAPVSRIPDLVEPAGDDTDLATLSAALPATLLDDLGRIARDLQVPIRSVLLAAHLRVLGLFAGQTDVVTGLVTHGRPEHEAGGRVLGLFLNSIPIRVSLTAPTWSALIQSTFAAEAAAMPHRRFPLMEIQRQSGQGTLFEVLFDFRDFHVYGDLPADGGVAVNGYQFFEQTNLPLAVNIIRSPADGTVSVQLKYARTRYSAAQVDAVLDAYLRILEAIAADPAADPRPTARYLLDDISRIGEWNATAVSYVGAVTLAGGVAAAVAGSPDARALCFRDEWLSYREFGGRVNRLARRLCAAGVGVGDVVGVCLDRGADLVVAVHAVVAAGAAYLPLEPDYPDDRLMFMVADAGVGLVITDRETRFPGVSTMAAAGEPDGSDGSALKVSIPPDALAYVIYTSGSTGRPKGVGVSHRAIVNRLSWMQQAFPLTGSDRVLHKTPFSFDVSVWELFWPLLVGAGLVVADAGGQRDPAYLGRLIESQEVSTVHFVPSMLDVFLDQPDVAVRCASLRRVMASGEALSPGLVARWYRVLPGVGLHNLYGPTEAAVDVTWHATLPGESRTPIGRPIANTRIEIVDADGQRVPIGTVGELCIGGVQLARGYLNRPSLTAERFVPDAFGAPGARLYRSGDLARWLPDGEVEYLGRIDHQVKVRGFRIELGEIEAALVDAPQVRSAVVTTYQDGSGSRLVGYVVPVADNGTDPDLIKTLQARLRERLPEHMVPASLVTLAELPLTANGKLARDALPAPQPVKDRPFTPPRSTAEQHIAQIWSDVLGVTQVSADDDFFALGGDSIRSLKVIARLRTNGYTVALQQIFQHPKVRELAAELDSPPPAATSAAPEPSTAFGLVNPADLALLSQVITGTAGKERS